jgi:hypothetical protein
MFPASGFCCKDDRPGEDPHNRYLAHFLREKGGRDAFTPLPGDLSVHEADSLLFVAVPESRDAQESGQDIRLPDLWAGVTRLVEELSDAVVSRALDGTFRGVKAGVYKMK